MTERVLLWMVVHEDTHGNRDLIRAIFLKPRPTRCWAQYKKDYQHKQEYYKFSYTPGARHEILGRERIRA